MSETKIITHFRLTIERAEALVFIQAFLHKWKIDKYMFAYEEKDENHHIHGHIEWTEIPTKQQLSVYMKKMGFAGKYYNDTLKKDPMNNLLYISKDLDLLDTNYEDEFVDKIVNQTEKINVDKSMDMRHKLLNLVKDNEKIDSMLKLEMYIEYHYVYFKFCLVLL